MSNHTYQGSVYRLSTPTGWTKEVYVNLAKAVAAAKLLATTVRIVNLDAVDHHEICDIVIVDADGSSRFANQL